MRTNIVLDDELVDEALEVTGATTKKEVVHLALRELVQRRKRRDMVELAGKLKLRDDFDHKKARTLRS
ncbi:MAG: type II toxin-antitoxin system VapB family antitoxin [Thermoanaerobaculia bacterium]